MQHIKPTNEAGRELAEYIKGRLASQRAALENVKVTDDDARVIRGRIAELKALDKELTNTVTNE